MLLSRFCLNAEGRKERKISILRSASASISHLKNDFSLTKKQMKRDSSNRKN